MASDKRVFGLISVILGASLWGIGGTATDWLFRNTPVNVDWYVTARLLISGVILVLFFLIVFKKKSTTVWDKYLVTRFVIYSIFGMTLVQYSFTATIGYGNAAIATVLQCTGPIYIILYYVFKKYIKFTYKEALVILFMIIGVILIATNGNLTQLIVSPLVLFWGILSGVALAYYTINAGYLLLRMHPLELVGGSMLVGGILLNFKTPIWSLDFGYDWSAFEISILLFSILIGTTLAFLLYIGSLKYITSQEAGILGLLEPVMAVLTTVIVLGDVLELFQVVGIALILGITVFNTIASSKQSKKEANA
ncbi:EamA family transporter [Nosocomiicoccus ampullae]|uniref:EamA family transporter n=1 Tax=Nosocomiicoccus ampullae TaxID=489910 RepID=UPI00254D0329|nr:DMT family transporter [Nosocomiicoccus ampullae]MDK6864152.1 DMT family transporter [Nosocomiicoccus ampullae]